MNHLLSNKELIQRMRRFQVRAKDITNKKWRYGAYLPTYGVYTAIIPKDDSFADQKHIIFSEVPTPGMEDFGFPTTIKSYYVDPATICACTGLRDKKRLFVYENDILVFDGDETEYIVKFDYSCGEGRFRLYCPTISDFIGVVNNIVMQCMIVKRNIFDEKIGKE